jgi:hypothetical protein
MHLVINKKREAECSRGFRGSCGTDVMLIRQSCSSDGSDKWRAIPQALMRLPQVVERVVLGQYGDLMLHVLKEIRTEA